MRLLFYLFSHCSSYGKFSSCVTCSLSTLLVLHNLHVQMSFYLFFFFLPIQSPAIRVLFCWTLCLFFLLVDHWFDGDVESWSLSVSQDDGHSRVFILEVFSQRKVSRLYREVKDEASVVCSLPVCAHSFCLGEWILWIMTLSHLSDSFSDNNDDTQTCFSVRRKSLKSWILEALVL